MSETTPAGAAHAPAISFAPESTHRNPAVQRCLQARESTYRALLKQNVSKYDARKQSNSAYCEAMPDLTDHNNIRNFVACVAHGLILGAVTSRDATRLLYAAQVAATLVSREPRLPGRPAHARPEPAHARPEPAPAQSMRVKKAQAEPPSAAPEVSAQHSTGDSPCLPEN